MKRKAGEPSDTALRSKRPAPHLEDHAIIDITIEHSTETLNPAAPEFVPINLPNTASPRITPSNNLKFPNNSIRQRTSNIPVDDPDKEFQKTALDACRSTIIQQETEIKRMKEGLDIRNKRIMQLESQVRLAASHISSRDQNQACTDDPSSSDSLLLILGKLDSLAQASSTPNISINNSHSCHGLKSSLQHNKSVQTETITENHIVSSYSQPQVFNFSSSDPSHHPESPHGSFQSFKCTVCSHVCISEKELIHHIKTAHSKQNNEASVIETSHTNQFINCKDCKYRCQSIAHLNEHMKADHHQQTDAAPLAQPTKPISAPPPASASSKSASSTSDTSQDL